MCWIKSGDFCYRMPLQPIIQVQFGPHPTNFAGWALWNAGSDGEPIGEGPERAELTRFDRATNVSPYAAKQTKLCRPGVP